MNKKDLLEIAAAFIVAWFLYHGLSFAVHTDMPIVAVASNSMEPVLHKGDLLFVTGVENPDVGDIVIYERPDVSYTIVHRIINKTDNGYIIKGDNNPAPDRGVVSREQISGRVVAAIPLLGFPRLAFMELLGI